MRADDVRHTAQFPHAPVVGKPYQTSVLIETLLRALAGAEKT